MHTLTLDGAWEAASADGTIRVRAAVPGCIHLDLLAAGQIPDPAYRDNERALFWIGETDWVYTRTFTLDAHLLAHERVLLRCHGLDTLATVEVNGQTVGRANNMYRTWEFDLKPFVHAGENAITMTFAAPVPYVRRMDAERGAMAGWVEPMRINSGGWIRKEPCNFGWDWGPVLVTSGIWRDIELIGYSTARLADVALRQQHADGAVMLTVTASAEIVTPAPLSAHVSITLDGQAVAQAHMPLDATGTGSAELAVPNPQLWWINGLGSQPLYDVTVTLMNGDTPLDTLSKAIGLRVLRLERHTDAVGESFCFSINGVRFFAKGANWIPADPFAARVRADDYERLVGDAAGAHMNMLRVWGGGIYEDDAFYDACDRHGVAVWQDFMFACGTYPAFDADFMANVAAEADDNIRRLRHHPSIALWCGNNEIEQGMGDDGWWQTVSWDDYGKLFDTLLPQRVRALDPDRDYVPASPHSPHGDRADHSNPRWGDTHLWKVWHGKQPFEWYRTRADRFVSEFGFQSLPHPATLVACTTPDDRNLTSRIMEYRQRSAIGNATIMHYLLDWFRLPTSFDHTVWLSQILQGSAMKYAVEHWRRNMPQTMGALYWQLNDCWAAPTWSSIDVSGRWKALHYMARQFYAPVLVSAVEDSDAQTVAVWATNDRRTALDAVLTWRITTAAGEQIRRETQAVTLAPHTSAIVTTLDCRAALASYGAQDVLVWLTLDAADGTPLSRNLATFARPKHLALRQPEIAVTFEQESPSVYRLSLSADVPALWVWLDADEADMRLSDNFVHLDGEHAVTITASVPGFSLDELRDRLRARSLTETYRER